jgi:galactokinase
MINSTILIKEIEADRYQDRLLDIYADKEKIEYEKKRYIQAVKTFEEHFGKMEVSVYSAPGRSEIIGNHTDHQHGEVLAASINNDAIGIVSILEEEVVKVLSDGFDMITIPLSRLEMQESEKGTTTALIKGVLSGVKERGYKIGGFQAYITSDVLIGAGLSSSAAYETIIGTIISGLYNDMKISATEIAMIGQYAENVYFGKPCGLMDQMACSVGSLVHVDFKEPDNPKVEKISFDMNMYGYSLCITDTKGSHADLTDDYAAIPAEMKKVASFFGKEVLSDVSREELLNNIVEVRQSAGDRGVLRALHFICENERVTWAVKALKQEQIEDFMQAIKESGDSSFKYLQNVYSNRDVAHQNVSVALAVSEMCLGTNGVCRVHGGGFAGTIQAFVKNEAVREYQNQMNMIFGAGSCSVLKIRRYGGMKVL